MNYLSKENVEEVVGLSPLQGNVLKREADGSTASRSIEQGVYTLTGTVDVAAFQQAWDHVIALHPALRVVFRAVKNRTVQVVLKTRPIVAQVYDVRNQSADDQQTAIAAMCRRHSEQVFSPAEGPLMRLALLLVADQEAILVWTHHEIILDDWSRRRVLSDLVDGYDAIRRREPLPERDRRPYGEYLTWLARQDWSPTRGFWAARLARFEAPTPLPLAVGDQSPVHHDAAPWMSRPLRLSEDLSRSLETLARQYNVTESAVIQAVWAILLSQYSNEEDVLFGLTCAGRPAAFHASHGMVGRFANTLPMHVRVDGYQRWSTFVQEIQQGYTDVAHYAHAPLDEVRDYGKVPAALALFDSCLTVHDGRDSLVEGATLRVETMRNAREQDHRLTVDVALGDAWAITLSAASTATTEPIGEEIDRVLACVQTLLESAAARPEARITDLAMLPPAAYATLLADFNKTAPGAPLDRLPHQIIEAQAAYRPDVVAAVHGNARITYGDLNARANRIAHCLRAQGFGRDDLAALCADRGIDMLVAILGVAKAGGAYMPLDAAYPDARLTTLLEASRATVILTQDHLAQRGLRLADTLPFPPAVLSLDTSTSYGLLADAAMLQTFLPADNPRFINHPHDLANVFYTSGSTGLPKGVMVEHIGVLNHLWAKIRLLGLDEKSVVVQNASHCFDISVWQFLAPLMVGGTVVICSNDVAGDPQSLLAAAVSSRATVLEVVPTMLEMLLQAAAANEAATSLAPDLRYVISTAEALPVSLCRKWLRACPHATIVNAYGPTECSDDTTHEVIAEQPSEGQTYMPIGRPISNFRVYILDRWQRPAPLGCIGELYFAGIGVGRGYLHDPERTASAFVPNPFSDGLGERLYRTGDLGRFLPDGRLIYIGRLDGQVKVRGRRIELGEIESVLLRHAAVKQTVVIARPDAAGQQQLLAYVVPGDAIDKTELRAFVAALLPAYMIPDHIVPLDALPLNRNGKVDRKVLPDIGAPAHSTAALVAPRDEVEEGLARIWQEVLDIGEVGIDESFFERGGHSLKTVQVRSRIQQRFGIDIALRTLFESQTIRELAPVVARVRAGVLPARAQTIPRRPNAEFYPMAHAQRRLWFLQHMEPGNCFYNLPSALELEGVLDVSALRQAFQAMVDRQAILRTTFTIVDGQPVQRVAPQVEWTCPVEDLSGLPSDDQAGAVTGIIDVDAGTPFDLDAGPLFRVRLMKLGANHYVLSFTVHHIIGDAWSSQALQREFAALYQAYVRRLPDPLAPLSIQYTDYAYWQNERLAGGQLEEDERYWLSRLGGPLPLLDLPIDHPRPPVQTYSGAAQELKLGADLLARIEHLCKQSDATLFMTLVAATATLLARVSGQEDIIIGSPVAGRDRVELEDVVGFFVNTLPLRIDVSGDPTFQDLLERVKSTALDAYAHQEYPFDQIVQQVNPTRDLSRSPIFSVMFQVDRAAPEIVLDGVVARPYPLPQQPARFDLAIVFTEMVDGLVCRLEYNADLFEVDTITWMLRRVQTLLEGIVALPARRLGELPLLGASERSRLLVDWNDTRAPYPRDRCIHHLIEAQVERTPNAVAVSYGDERLTYRDLNRRANGVAHHLRTLGVGPEALVGIYVERSLDMVVGLLGILKAGAAYLPLDPVYPTERLAYMLADARVPVLLTQRRLVDGLPAHNAQVVCVDDLKEKRDAESTANPDSGAMPDNLAYAIYTSGSTGKPKGVQVPHAAVVNFLASMRRQPGLTDEDTLLAVTSLSFDIAALELFLPLTVGARLVVVGREVATDGESLARHLASSGATVLQATPSTWRLLLESGWRNSTRIKMLCGGEALPVELAAQLLPEDANLWNLYGPTETTIWSATYPVTATAAGPMPIGRPIANTQIYLLDRRLQPVPIGVSGELYIGGAGVTRGYVNRPELTAERFVPDPFCIGLGRRLYRTGDLARYRLDGELEYLGRLDHQVKLRGYRIELGEIEAVLSQHPGVREAVVVAREDTPGDKHLVAYVVPRTEPALAGSDLRGYLTGKLPEYMTPSVFVPLDALPLTLNGKVDRKALPTPSDSPQLQPGQTYVAPRDPVEAAMTMIWEDVLRVRPVGVFDDFFAIGGHSMTAVMLVNVVRQHFAVDLPLTVLFQTPTVADLCAYLRARVAPSSGSVVPIKAGGSNPPLFLVHPQGGGVLCYLHLTRALGALDGETPVYGVEAIGYDSAEPPLETIEAMADRHIEEIRRLAPHGPYRLAGWSFGGLVAFEMARRLEALGEHVNFLGLVDVYPFGREDAVAAFDARDDQGSESELVSIAVHQLGMDRTAFAGVDEEQGIALVLQRAKELRMMPQEAVADAVRGRVRMMALNGAAMRSYRYLGPIQADIHLFHAIEAPDDAGHPLVDAGAWRERTAGHLHVIPLPGDHHNLVNPPHVSALAAEINAALGVERVRPAA